MASTKILFLSQIHRLEDTLIPKDAVRYVHTHILKATKSGYIYIANKDTEKHMIKARTFSPRIILTHTCLCTCGSIRITHVDIYLYPYSMYMYRCPKPSYMILYIYSKYVLRQWERKGERVREREREVLIIAWLNSNDQRKRLTRSVTEVLLTSFILALIAQTK